MIVSWMAFLFVVSALAGVAAALVEGGLGRWGAPSRFAWLGALALGPAIVAGKAVALLRPTASLGPPAWVPVLELPPLTVAAPPASPGLGLEDAATLAWLLSALGLAVMVVRTHALLLRERGSWESTQVLGQDVFVSADRGPAVAGVWRPWIVLPRWVLSLPEQELRMVLLHEAEHVRARDTHLLGGALALVALSAWNPVTWWQLRRLRAAMELDCDRRVLRREPDRACYGSSLLTVAARASGPSLGLAAFTERSLNMKRRILAMTAKTSRWTALGGGVLVVSGLVVGLQACGVDTPVGITPVNGPMPVMEVVAADAGPGQVLEVRSAPGQTPFTSPPVLLTRRDELAAAIEANYPPLLRDAGIGGQARVWMFVDATGTVTALRLDGTSGHQALDDAALRVVPLYRFTPAKNGDEPVGVWVAIPVTFGTPPSSEPPFGAELRREIPGGGVQDLRAGPTFTPFTVAPSLLNREEVGRSMTAEYPEEFRSAGVGGTVRVFFLIDADGNVARAVVDQSSGTPALDEAALRVAAVYRFKPALNRDTPVPVWVSFPIIFMTAESELAVRTIPPAVRTSPDQPEGQVVPPTIEAGPTFTPFTVAPAILNRNDVVRSMAAEYPPLLREAGIGGTARLYFLIDAEGQVQDVRVDRSSGHQALDEAALRVARVYRFSPALNRDEPVPAWVAFPITFQVMR